MSSMPLRPDTHNPWSATVPCSTSSPLIYASSPHPPHCLNRRNILYERILFCFSISHSDRAQSDDGLARAVERDSRGMDLQHIPHPA